MQQQPQQPWPAPYQQNHFQPPPMQPPAQPAQWQQQPPPWQQQPQPGPWQQGPWQQPQQRPPYPYQQPFPQPAPKAGGNKAVAALTVLVIALCVALVAVWVQSRGGGGPLGPTASPTPEWKNDDYVIPTTQSVNPPLPQATVTDMNELMEQNTLYDESLAVPVRCEMTKKDMAGATSSEMKARLEEQLDCLLRVWGPALDAADYKAIRPTITVMTAPRQTPCGKMMMKNAMYCARDQNLYFAIDVLDVLEMDDKTWALESIMAHEFAHLVQGRSGIIPARNLAADKAKTESEALLLVRRNEAQADCMAAMFFRSTSKSLEMTSADHAQVISTFRNFGSDRAGRPRVDKESTHPKMHTREAWATKGLGNSDVAVCNSYVVSPDKVA